MEIAANEGSAQNANKASWPHSSTRGEAMNVQVLVPVMLMSLLSGCGQEQQPAVHQEKTFGGQLGDSYKGMLNGAEQSADNANQQMQRTEQAVRDR